MLWKLVFDICSYISCLSCVAALLFCRAFSAACAATANATATAAAAAIVIGI